MDEQETKESNNKMKTMKKLMTALSLIAAAVCMQSCDTDDDHSYIIDPTMPRYNALVTVKPNADNTAVYLQLDDSTTVFPLNLGKSPFGAKEMRALTALAFAKDNTAGYDKTATVLRLDSILTKPMAQSLGTEKNAAAYGTDPVEMVKDWVSIAEDGYLTLRFRTNWDGKAKHWVNLVAADPQKPYDLTFYHSAQGDANSYTADGLVAFSLDQLPDTGGKTVSLTLHWNSFSGEKTATFKFRSRSAATQAADLSNLNYVQSVE